MKKAIYPGTFDPITYGHIDIIERAITIFDEVIVAVATNPRKTPLFSVDERLDMIQQSTRNLQYLTYDRFDGLLVDYAKKINANVLIRGLRAVSDFEFEFQLALVNRKLSNELVTVFLMPGEKYTYLNSTIVKEIAAFGADISAFVPDNVAENIYRRLQRIK
jgi:pantetheine-phosphate adenylyltransferase